MTVEIQTKKKDEVGQLTNSFSTLVQSFQHLISIVQRNLLDLNSSASELEQVSNQNETASKEVYAKVQDVAKGSLIQSKQAHESTTAMNELVTAIGHLNENTANVSELAGSSLIETEAGNQSIQAASSQMTAIQHSVKNAIMLVKRLEERSKKIEDIVAVINSISDQTNLLALNASIEAARAGEHGKGFAVVATEVRKLAEQSKKYSENIAEIINEIQSDTGEIVLSTNQVDADVNQGLEIITVSGNNFSKIKETVEQVTSKVQDLSATFEQMSASSQQVLASISEIADIANNTAVSAEKVEHAAINQQQLSGEVSITVEQLREIANQLEATIKEYKT